MEPVSKPPRQFPPKPIGPKPNPNKEYIPRKVILVRPGGIISDKSYLPREAILKLPQGITDKTSELQVVEARKRMPIAKKIQPIRIITPQTDLKKTVKIASKQQKDNLLEELNKDIKQLSMPENQSYLIAKLKLLAPTTELSIILDKIELEDLLSLTIQMFKNEVEQMNSIEQLNKIFENNSVLLLLISKIHEKSKLSVKDLPLEQLSKISNKDLQAIHSNVNFLLTEMTAVLISSDAITVLYKEMYKIIMNKFSQDYSTQINSIIINFFCKNFFFPIVNDNLSEREQFEFLKLFIQKILNHKVFTTNDPIPNFKLHEARFLKVNFGIKSDINSPDSKRERKKIIEREKDKLTFQAKLKIKKRMEELNLQINEKQLRVNKLNDILISPQWQKPINHFVTVLKS